ncbi:MAG TPA: glycosyltransferase family 39 protein [Gemmatimonadaceae bacterium]|nr:glycosyltransferase family 39 protein [Gemmatimonadaceae bacterium]
MRTTGDRAAAGWAATACGIAVVTVATKLPHDWVPFDEGTIALSARMVAAGYLPHRDFAYPYTGALAWWNAAGVRAFGPSMLVPRWQLFALFLAWLPAVWSLTRRFAPPALAAASMALAAWWSVLVYPAAMPTTVVLFLTTWSLVALARWADDERPRWLVLAGVCAGTAITVKQTGLYTLVGAGLGVLAIAQARAAEPGGEAPGARGPIDAVVTALLGAGMLVPAVIVWRRGVLGGELLLALPLMGVMGALGARGRTPGAGRALRRTVVASWGALLAGAAVPVVALVAWFAANGALGALYDGAVVGGERTAATIARAMPPVLPMIALAMPVAAAVWMAGWPRTAPRRMAAATVGALVICVAAMEYVPAYRAVWYAAQVMACAAVCGVAWQSRRAAVPYGHRGVPLAIACATALLGLNALPYAAPNYFAYAAPLAVLSGIAWWSVARDGVAAAGRPASPWLRSPLPVLLFLAFGGWFHRIGSVHTVGDGSIWWDDAHRLVGPAGGVRVTAADSATYARLRELVAAHGGPDAFAAGPELSALYLLSGTTRVVRQPFLLVPDAHADSTAMAQLLDTTATRAVAINLAPTFLPVPGPGVRAWLAARYPFAERVGDIDFRWR